MLNAYCLLIDLPPNGYHGKENTLQNSEYFQKLSEIASTVPVINEYELINHQ